MNKADIKNRIDFLLNDDKDDDLSVKSYGLFYGTLNIMAILYGNESVQVENFIKEGERIQHHRMGDTAARELILLSKGVLYNTKAELETGLIENLQKIITGEILTDFLELARTVLDEKGDSAKNVSAVLSAALFEDTIRRLAISNGIPHIEKLQDVIIELKNRKILQGSQVGIANSYLNFRNSSLHAQWDRVEREAVASVLGFVEQLLMKHFD